ncbi:MAG TPA: TIGR03000 domain-containing protein, partial [Gemmataceae bacterium]|nr:TIGR03000 domain-containing protein [Gemmataceae bacterium]
WPWLSAFGFWGWPGYWGGNSWWPNYGYYDGLPYYGGYGALGAYGAYGGAPYAGVMPPYNPPTVSPPPIQANANTAQMDVFVPDENAQVWFDGSLTSSKGSTRYFDSPPLQAGSTYQYVLRAAWTQNGRPMTAETTVSVTAGSQVVVDFTQTPPKVTTVR